MAYYPFLDDYSGEPYGSCEVFYVNKHDALQCRKELWDGYHLPLEESSEVAATMGGTVTTVPGWYWQACFPGCLPDSSAQGPFETEQAAIEDANLYTGES